MHDINTLYEDTIAFLMGAIDYEKISKYSYDSESFNLERMKKLMDAAGNPHCCFETVHVAGTKGKGSTSNMISSILREARLKTGLFTSPHLVNLEERIRINGEEISRLDLCKITDSLRPYIEKEREKDMALSPTYFETLTAIALVYFANEEVDIAVMEVGLGGRLDSTNIVTPLVSVITSIGFDHTDKLGSTLKQIAGEKSGIIKDRVPVVCSMQKDEALGVVQETCIKTDSRLILVGRDTLISNVRPYNSDKIYVEKENSVFGSLCDIRTEQNLYSDLVVPLPGRHQVVNSACAISAAEIALDNIANQKPTVSGINREQLVSRALKNIKCSGRIEVISHYPLVVVDSAHTVESICALKDTIKEYMNADNVTLMLGMCKDKDIAGVLNEIMPSVNKIIFTTTGNPRSANPEDYRDVLNTYKDKPSYTITDISKALKLAMEITDRSGMICVTGSTFLAGNVISLLKKAED